MLLTLTWNSQPDDHVHVEVALVAEEALFVVRDRNSSVAAEHPWSLHKTNETSFQVISATSLEDRRSLISLSKT